MSGIVRGNFTGQPDGRFPLDVETLQQLQDYVDAIGVVFDFFTPGTSGQFAVRVLSGCELDATMKSRSPGWVVVKNQTTGKSELVWFVGGLVANGFYVKREGVSVTADGVAYDNAYTRSTAVPGQSADSQENYSWNTLTAAKTTLQDVLNKLEELDMSIANDASPVGSIILAEEAERANWRKCNGVALSKNSCGELFGIVGYKYGGVGDVFNLPQFLPVTIKSEIGDTYYYHYYMRIK